MPNFIQRRFIHLLVLISCLLAVTSSSLLAQDTPTDTPTEAPPSATPTDVPTDTPTEIPPTDIPTDIPTEIPPSGTPTDIPTDTPTEVTPSATPLTETSEPVTETATTPATVEAAPTIPAPLPPEPELSLLARELFEAEPLIGWTLPAGWTRAAVSDGFALRVNAAEAGLNSAVTLGGAYYNVVVMGYFTFADSAGAAQLVVRDSSAGSYLAQVDANGLVTLEKRDGAGTVVASWNAIAQPASGAARALRLSAMGGVLRVAVEDAASLPPGGVKVGAQLHHQSCCAACACVERAASQYQ